MAGGAPKIVIRPGRSVADYALEVIVTLRQVAPRVGLIAYGQGICRLADVVAAVKDRLGDDVRIVGWEIDNRRTRGRRESFLYVELEYRPSF